MLRFQRLEAYKIARHNNCSIFILIRLPTGSAGFAPYTGTQVWVIGSQRVPAVHFVLSPFGPDALSPVAR